MASFSSGGLVVRVDPGLGVVGARAAEFLEGDVLAGDGLDHVRAGDEHVRGLVDHDDEVGQRGGVDRAAGGRAHDQRDLRDDAGGVHVAEEDLREGPSATTPSWIRAPPPSLIPTPGSRLHREVHHLDDLLAVDLAERCRRRR
jgi:hypothetical protein